METGETKKRAVLLGHPETSHLRNVMDPPLMERVARRVALHPAILGPDGPATTEDREAAASAEIAFSSWGMAAFPDAILASRFPRLRILFHAAGTVQAFAAPFLDRGVRVSSAASANAVPVAQFAAAMILLANKDIFRIGSGDPAVAWARRNRVDACPGNYRTPVGILGFGAIGSRVVDLLSPMGLDPWVYDPFMSPDAIRRRGGRPATLEAVFSGCRTISCHLADKPETRGMLDYALFSRMGSSAAFLNTGRGAQVREDDLARALREEPGRFAILDVTCPEPPTRDHPFRGLDNILFTPHIAGSTGREILRLGEFAADELDRYLDGQPLLGEVRQEDLSRMA